MLPLDMLPDATADAFRLIFDRGFDLAELWARARVRAALALPGDRVALDDLYAGFEPQIGRSLAAFGWWIGDVGISSESNIADLCDFGQPDIGAIDLARERLEIEIAAGDRIWRVALRLYDHEQAELERGRKWVQARNRNRAD